MIFRTHKVRYKQIDKAVDLCTNPDSIGIIKEDDDDYFSKMIFIPKGQEEEYKAVYGDKLRFLF